MHPLLQRITAPSRVAGLEAQSGPDGLVFHLAILRRKRSRAIVESFHTGMRQIADLKKILPRGIPVILVVTGKGILSKKAAAEPGNDTRALLSKVLTNASLNDFYLSAVQAEGGEMFVSVMRKKSTDELLQKLQEKDIDVLACMPGPVVLQNILSLLGEDKREIVHAGNYELEFRNGLLYECRFNGYFPEQTVVLQTEQQEIAPSALIAFAAALSKLSGTDHAFSADVSSLTVFAKDFNHRQLFKKAVAVFLVFTLTLLTGNYFAFTGYWNKKSALEDRFRSGGSALENVRLLQKQVKARHNFLQQAGMLGDAHNALFADRIAAGIPSSILLTRMSISPRIKTTDEDTIAFANGKIELEGTSTESVVLNQWLQQLNNTPWISKAVLSTYAHDKNMPEGQFSIELEIRE